MMATHGAAPTAPPSPRTTRSSGGAHPPRATTTSDHSQASMPRQARSALGPGRRRRPGCRGPSARAARRAIAGGGDRGLGGAAGAPVHAQAPAPAPRRDAAEGERPRARRAAARGRSAPRGQGAAADAGPPVVGAAARHQECQPQDGLRRSPRAGWQHVHVAIDDHSRLAYARCGPVTARATPWPSWSARGPGSAPRASRCRR